MKYEIPYFDQRRSHDCITALHLEMFFVSGINKLSSDIICRKKGKKRVILPLSSHPTSRAFPTRCVHSTESKCKVFPSPHVRQVQACPYRYVSIVLGQTFSKLVHDPII